MGASSNQNSAHLSSHDLFGVQGPFDSTLGVVCGSPLDCVFGIVYSDIGERTEQP